MNMNWVQYLLGLAYHGKHAGVKPAECDRDEGLNKLSFTGLACSLFGLQLAGGNHTDIP